MLFAFSAASSILLSHLFLSPPCIPKSHSRDAIVEAGNPLHPTSTAHAVTAYPFFRPSLRRTAYFVFFSFVDTSIKSSHGTVNLRTPILLVLLDSRIIMSSQRFVFATSSGTFVQIHLELPACCSIQIASWWILLDFLPSFLYSVISE